MRYDKSFAYFRPHFDWYRFEHGVGYVPTEKAPEEARKAMDKYNSYTYPEWYNKNKNDEK